MGANEIMGFIGKHTVKQFIVVYITNIATMFTVILSVKYVCIYTITIVTNKVLCMFRWLPQYKNYSHFKLRF